MNKLERQYLVENSELSRSSRLARRFDVELNIWSQRKFEIPISVIDAFKVVKSKAYEGTDIELVAQVGCYRIKLTDEILDESSAKVILNGVADLCKKPFEISNETPAYSPHELK